MGMPAGPEPIQTRVSPARRDRRKRRLSLADLRVRVDTADMGTQTSDADALGYRFEDGGQGAALKGRNAAGLHS